MKKKTRLCCFLLLISLLLCSVQIFSVSAQDMGALDVQYKQKIVAVIFDESGSMLQESSRTPAAKYSLGMLISLLDPRDQMYVVPMNKSTKPIQVDLASADREGVMNSIVNNSVINPRNGQGTPSRSMTGAINLLKDNGLKSAEELADTDPNKEFWMVVLTDGAFEGDSNSDNQAKYVKNAIDGYPTLHTVYVSFGSGAVDISGKSALSGYPISTYCKVDAKATQPGKDDLVTVIQKISNQVSGRYPLTNTDTTTYYRVDGNKVTVDLNTLPFSLSSLSVVAQDCGGDIKNVSYEGADSALGNVSISLKNKCILPGDSSVLNIKSGCSFEAVSPSYLLGGNLVFEFTEGSSLEQVSILAKPAMNVSYYVEMLEGTDWNRIDISAISNVCDAKDSIRVGYEVTDPVKGTPIDLKNVFGDVTTEVSYVQNKYEMGQVFPLVEGTNDLSVQISMMGGAFTLRDSQVITILGDYNDFRIEAQGDTEVFGASAEAGALFTVYLNGQPATLSDLAGYVFSVKTAKGSTGEVIYESAVTPSSDGKINVKLPLSTNAFDAYSITLFATSPAKAKRECTHTVTYVPSSLELSVEGTSQMTATQYELIKNEKEFVFKLTANGQPFPFDNTLAKYTLFANGKDVTAFAKVEGNTLSYAPNEGSLQGLTDKAGEIEISLVVKSDSMPSLDTSAAARITVEKTEFAVVPVDTGNKKIDIFRLPSTSASLAFTVQRDGIPLTYDEMLAIEDKLSVDTTQFFKFFLFPAGITTAIEPADGDAGAFVVKAGSDMARYFEWHFAAFMLTGDKPVTVSYGEVTGTDSFDVVPASIVIRIFRILCLLIAIAIVAYLTAYVLGFFIAKPLPSGVFIRITSTGADELTYVNEKIWKIVVWHLKRFISPKKLWTNQPVDGQVPYCDNMEFSHGKNNRINMTPITENCIYRLNQTPNGSPIMRRYVTGLSKGAGISLRTLVENARLRDGAGALFSQRGAAIRTMINSPMTSGAFYGCYRKSGNNERLTYAVGFRSIGRK